MISLYIAPGEYFLNKLHYPFAHIRMFGNWKGGNKETTKIVANQFYTAANGYIRGSGIVLGGSFFAAYLGIETTNYEDIVREHPDATLSNWDGFIANQWEGYGEIRFAHCRVDHFDAPLVAQYYRNTNTMLGNCTVVNHGTTTPDSSGKKQPVAQIHTGTFTFWGSLESFDGDSTPNVLLPVNHQCTTNF